MWLLKLVLKGVEVEALKGVKVEAFTRLELSAKSITCHAWWEITVADHSSPLLPRGRRDSIEPASKYQC